MLQIIQEQITSKIPVTSLEYSLRPESTTLAHQLAQWLAPGYVYAIIDPVELSKYDVQANHIGELPGKQLHSLSECPI